MNGDERHSQDHASGPQRMLDAREALRGAAEAMRDGRAWDAAAAMLDSPLLDGLAARLQRQYPRLRWDGAQEVLADAIDALVEEIERGGRPDRPDAWLWKVCQRRAMDELDRQKSLDALPGTDELGELAATPTGGDGSPSRDILRREAIRVVREHLPRIAQIRQRDALEVIIDGVDRRVEVTNPQLAEALGVSLTNARKLRERAFTRLTEALVMSDHHLTYQYAFELEELEFDATDDPDEEED